MSTFLFATIPVAAHTSNPLPIAARLVERGHNVLWYVGSAYHDRIAAVGAQPLPYVDAADFGGHDIFEYFPQFTGLSPLKTISRAFADVFVGEAPARVRDLRRILAEHSVDAMLSDGLMYGVGMAGELEGVPWATFGDGPLPFEEPDTPPFGPGLLPMRGPVGRLRNRLLSVVAARVVFRDAQRVYDRARADLGLPRDSRAVAGATGWPYLHLQASTPAFEYPHRNLPGHVHWVGALRPDAPKDWVPPVWWGEVTGSTRPVVHLTQGSLRPDLTELIIPSLQALADEEVLVVVTTGGASADQVEAAYGGPLPTNARVTKFIPYDTLLAHTALFLTNGGYSGVTLALAHGVPIVQAGTTEEKAEIAARIEWTGVGLRLGPIKPRPDAVREAVRRVLTEPSFRAAAENVHAEMADHDAGVEAAVLMERLAAIRRPVPRDTSLADFAA